MTIFRVYAPHLTPWPCSTAVVTIFETLTAFIFRYPQIQSALPPHPFVVVCFWGWSCIPKEVVPLCLRVLTTRKIFDVFWFSAAIHKFPDLTPPLHTHTHMLFSLKSVAFFFLFFLKKVQRGDNLQVK